MSVAQAAAPQAASSNAAGQPARMGFRGGPVALDTGGADRG